MSEADVPQLPVALVGMMAVGKTTVGRAVAKHLGVPWADTDRMISRATNRSIPDIFEHDGEAEFRQLESQALQDALDRDQVVSCGGGIVVTGRNRSLLVERAPVVVWLRARVATIVHRVGTGASRPMLDGDFSDVISRLSSEREALYSEVATITIDVDDLSFDRVAAIVVETVFRGEAA